MHTCSLSSKQLLSTILSHGWFALKPFQVDLKKPSITITYDLPIGSGSIVVNGSNDSGANSIKHDFNDDIYTITSNCLSLDQNTSKLYQKISDERWNWIEQKGLGRFLRSASLFEDCSKAILSTNTTWQRTISMVEKLVDNYGNIIGKTKAFPTPERILTISELELRKNVSCGYRAKYLHHLSKTSLENPEIFLGNSWKRLTNKEFYGYLQNINGLGPTTINYLSLMYWKFNGFVIDAYVKKRCIDLWNASNNLEDFFNERYKIFGIKAPLILWLEITKHWHDLK